MSSVSQRPFKDLVSAIATSDWTTIDETKRAMARHRLISVRMNSDPDESLDLGKGIRPRTVEPDEFILLEVRSTGVVQYAGPESTAAALCKAHLIAREFDSRLAH